MGLALRPWYDVLDVVGSVSYDISARSWALLRLKKEFINQFPQLKEKRGKFSYRMVFYNDYKDLKKVVNKMEKNKDPLPILLYFIQEKVRE
ncbi:hypothetical protein GF358_00220 [Candidatus Woesearchaeota archaeon]|nr:hypothetical protein [Candidatus Woesearchaeota archaeon]